MKQYILRWHYYSTETQRAVLVEEYGFKRYIAKRIKTITAQSNFIDYKVMPTGYFFKCLFREVVYH